MTAPAFQSGDHICFASVNREERIRTVAGYLRQGLARGECAVYAAPVEDLAAVAQALDASGLARDRLLRSGALVLREADSLYGSGEQGGATFDPIRTLRQVQELIDACPKLGFAGLSAAGYANQSTHTNRPAIDPELARRYEAGVNSLMAGRNVKALCVYDRRTAPAALFESALRTHPVMLLGDRVCQNHFCEPAFSNDWTAADVPELSDRRRVNWMINRIIRAHDSEVQLRALTDTHLNARLCAHGSDKSRTTDKLLRSIEMRDTLFAMVARQLGTALTDLKVGLTGPACASSGGRRELRELRELLEPLGRLSSRLSDIAGFMKFDVTLNLDKVELVAVVEEAVATLAAQASPGMPDIRFSRCHPLVGRWDRARVKQVFASLLSVAHEQSWGMPLTVSIESCGPMARIGIGYQGEDCDGHRSDYDRLGIELFVGRELVHLMGGKLGVASWPDGTVMFTVELPLRELDGDPLLH